MPDGLFEADVPAGFLYQPDFITSDEESRLASEMAHVQFTTFEMRGVVARRRVAFFGRSYDSATEVTLPMPAFLMGLRDTVAAWAGLDPQAFAMAERVRAPHSGGDHVALFGDVSHVASLSPQSFSLPKAPETLEAAGIVRSVY
jgi:hypothetical protein